MGCRGVRAKKARRQSRFTQNDVTRAVRGLQRAGLEPARVEIDESGCIVMQMGGTRPTDGSSWDDVL